MTRPTSKAVEALNGAITNSFLRDFPKKPGAVISKLSKETREALQQLTSDEALTMRPEKWWDSKDGK